MKRAKGTLQAEFMSVFTPEDHSNPLPHFLMLHPGGQSINLR